MELRRVVYRSTFNSTVDGGKNLTVTAATQAEFKDKVGNGTALSALTSNGAGSTKVSTDTIKTTGDQSYNTVSLNSDTTLTGDNVTFNNTVDGAKEIGRASCREAEYKHKVGNGTSLTKLTS